MPFSPLMHTDCTSCLPHRILTVLDLLQYGQKNMVDIESLSERLFTSLFADSEFSGDFAVGSHGARMSKALAILKEGYVFETPTGSVQKDLDCSRFFLSLLTTFQRIDVGLLCCEEPVRWEIYSTFIEGAYERLKVKLDHEKFLKRAMLPLHQEFEEDSPWRVKVALIKGMRGIVNKVFEDSPIFWTCCEEQLKHCCAAISCFERGSVPPDIYRAACDIVDLWRNLSHSAKQRIKELDSAVANNSTCPGEKRRIESIRQRLGAVVEAKIVGAATDLAWVIDHCQLPPNMGVYRYTEMLKDLELDTVTAVERLDGKVPRRSEETVMKLSRIYTKYVFGRWQDPGDANCGDRTVEDSLGPYLLGQKKKADLRLIEEPKFAEAELGIVGIVQKLKVIVDDICGKTKRVFRVTTDQLRVHNPQKLRYPIRREDLGKVKLRHKAKVVNPKHMILEIPYPVSSGKKTVYKAECELMAIGKEAKEACQ